MRLHRALLVLVPALAAAGALGCSHSIVSTDGDLAPGPDLGHVIAAGCSGAVKGSIYGVIIDCTVAITQDAGELMRITPTLYKGDTLDRVWIVATVTGSFAVKTYTLADLDIDTLIEFRTKDGLKRYSAGKDATGNKTGDVKLELYSMPTPPDSGLNAWFDTTVHGTLTATLVHDVTTPGMDPDPQMFTASF